MRIGCYPQPMPAKATPTIGLQRPAPRMCGDRASQCPQSDSNRHLADFKSAASANWAMGAHLTRHDSTVPPSTASRADHIRRGRPSDTGRLCELSLNRGSARAAPEEMTIWVFPRSSASVVAPAAAAPARARLTARTSAAAARSSSKFQHALPDSGAGHPRRRSFAVPAGLSARNRQSDPVQDVVLADDDLVDSGALGQCRRQLLDHDRSPTDHVDSALVHRP